MELIVLNESTHEATASALRKAIQKYLKPAKSNETMPTEEELKHIHSHHSEPSEHKSGLIEFPLNWMAKIKEKFFGKKHKMIEMQPVHRVLTLSFYN
jgi:hypothetical protein